MSEYAIELSKVNYSYPSDWSWKRTPCLHDVSLQVRRGETFGFLGHNGAGKTTTIKCILGLVKISSGSITISGIPWTEVKARNKVGYLPEHPYFYDHLTVDEILHFYATLSDIPTGKRAAAVDRALELVHMKTRRKQRMRELSKGLTQRIAMAQSIVGYPEVLILDEPFSGLDPLGRKEFTDLLCMLKDEEKCTTIICSHVLKDVEVLCDRVSIMLRGHLKGVYPIDNLPALGPAEYVLTVRHTEEAMSLLKEGSVHCTSNEAFIRLRYPNESLAKQALERAVKEGVSVDSYHPIQPGLEEVFVHMVQDDIAHHGGGENS